MVHLASKTAFAGSSSPRNFKLCEHCYCTSIPNKRTSSFSFSFPFSSPVGLDLAKAKAANQEQLYCAFAIVVVVASSFDDFAVAIQEL